MVAISRKKFKSCGNHEEFLARIKKTLYYGELPITERLSLPVTELASELFSQSQYGKSLERLHCDVAADISLDACISPCSLVLAMLYLERLKKCNPEYLQRIAPSELFLVSLMVSTKFLTDEGEEDDVFINEWAQSGNVTKEELLQLEKEFLNAIDWNVFVKENEFLTNLFKLEHDVALRQGKTRGGWFTYTDLYHLIEDIEIVNIFQSLLTVTTVLMASYTASVLTIFSSVLLVSHVPGTSLYKNNALVPSDNLPVSIIHSKDLGEAVNNTETQENNLKTILEAVEKLQENDTVENFVEENDVCHKFPISPVNVLTTSFILASIKTNQSNDYTSITDSEHAENITWDWWSNDLMQWLSSISNPDISPQNAENNVGSNQNIRKMAHDTIRFDLLINQNDIKETVHTRIQDQLEQSWHKEWTESITNYKHVFGNFLSYYGKIIKTF